MLILNMPFGLRCCVILAFVAAQAVAAPLTWVLSGITFSDGGTASGSFVYDANTNTYSSVNITTIAGSVRTTGATYHFVCGQDVPSCNGVSPSAGFNLNLTSAAANQTGLPGFALFFSSALTNAGGSVSVTGEEANCSNSTCTAPVSPERSITGGSVSTVAVPATPAPSSVLLVSAGLLFAGFYAWWARRDTSVPTFRS